MNDVSTYVAFTAGIASFLSPCFLPLIPIYIGFISGKVVDNKNKWNVIINAVAFIIGFTVIFVVLGVTASGLGHLFRVYRREINKFLGLIVIFMGLFYMDIIKIKFLNMEKRFYYNGKKNSFIGAIILGVALAFGWTPCIGYILASVMSIAASKNSYVYGMYLLFIYSMGIAIPFLITAIFLESLSLRLKAIMRYTRIIKIITGLILILSGILIYMDYLGKLSGKLF
jgi:cytochrome c-type biogenesis protein